MAIQPATRSLSEDAYARLRSAIIHGEIRPNERLVETELAERLSLSRTPVREGLQRLASEGLVVTRRRGWVVYEHTPAEIEDIYEVRAALEGYAALLAAERADEPTLAGIRTVHLRALKSPTTLTPRQSLVDINDEFHDAIIDAAGNPRLTHQTRTTREYFFNYRIADLYTDDEAARSVAGHEALVEALLVREAEHAQKVAEAHVLEALEVTLSKVR